MASISARAVPIAWLAGIALLAMLAIAGASVPGWHGLHLLAKPATTLAIIAMAMRLHGELLRYRSLVIAGLCLGLVGDVLLMLPREWAFMGGLGSFLLGHLAYLQAWRLRGPWFAPRWPFALYALVCAGVLAWLWPHLPPGLRGPVAAYVLVIGAMAAQALATWRTRRGRATAFAAWGGAAFVVSDTVLAVDRFVQPFAGAMAILLASYWIAQALIALSIDDAAGDR